MTLPVVFRPEAAADVRAAHAWYESQRTGLGDEFTTALDADLGLLQQSPTSFPVIGLDLRRLLLRRFPYAVYFRVEADVIVIRGVLHHRRHPRRWRRRA